ncbi:MAG: O-methyltransferase [Anaerolineae bacterium]
MDEELKMLLKELEQFGNDNDAQTANRSNKMLNITPDTGAFLHLLIRALGAKRVLEIGTSNGYSTLWLAEAVQPLRGKVVTLEIAAHKAEMARANFARAGVQEWVELHLGDAGEFLKQQQADSFDFVFLDSNRESYVGWWGELQGILRPGGLLVVDNAESHAHELTDFFRCVHETPGYITSLVPVGKGEFVVLKEAPVG